MNKNKHILIASSLVAILSIASFFAVFPLSKKSSTSKGSNWMKDIDDSRTLTSLSIPGSHDSGALHSIADLAGKCQDLSIYNQLEAGARFFDIRLQQRDNELKIVHGFVDQDLSFSQALDDFKRFLNEHPSEGLIVSIKKESNANNTSATFDESLKEALKNYSSLWDLSREIPNNLGKLRGKIYLISRYSDSTIGLDAFEGWLDPDSSSTTNTFDIGRSNLHIQDYYQVNDIENKKSEISKCFDYSKENPNVLTLNFSSCYFINAFPPTYAGTTAKIINNWLIDEINDRSNLGIIVSDFITSDLCEKIYKRN